MNTTEIKTSPDPEVMEKEFNKAFWSIWQQSAVASLLKSMIDDSVHIGREIEVEQQVGISTILESMHKELDKATKLLEHIQVHIKPGID